MSSAPNDEPDDHALLTAEDAATFLQANVSWIYEHGRPLPKKRLTSIVSRRTA